MDDPAKDLSDVLRALAREYDIVEMSHMLDKSVEWIQAKMIHED